MLDRLKHYIEAAGWQRVVIEIFLIYVILLLAYRLVQGTRGAGVLRGLVFLLVGAFVSMLFVVKHFQLYAIEWLMTGFLPIFIVRGLPVGVRGLIVAAVFAAAISSLDSALAALSQTTVSAFKKPVTKTLGKLLRRKNYRTTDIGLSRIMVVGWGIILCLMATACIAISSQYDNVIDLAFGLTAYTYGPLLAILLMALMPRKRDGAGLMWAVPVAMLTVFGISVHVESLRVPLLNVDFNWADWVVWIGAAIMLGLALVKLKGDVRRVAAIVFAVLTMVLLHSYQAGVGPLGEPKYISFTWSFPIGAAVTFAIGQLFGNDATAGAAKPKQRKAAKGPSRRNPRRKNR